MILISFVITQKSQKYDFIVELIQSIVDDNSEEYSKRIFREIDTENRKFE